VGVVLKEEVSRAQRSTVVGPDVNKSHYLTRLKLAPGVIRLLGTAELTGEVKSAGDYSYSASYYAGPNYRIAGDAGGQFRSLLCVPNTYSFLCSICEFPNAVADPPSERLPDRRSTHSSHPEYI
jgi:hypothetical protein